MVVPQKISMIEQFEAVINAPENADKRFEFIDGEIIELPSNAYSSQISMYVMGAVLNFVDEHELAHVTGEGGGYKVEGWNFAPDGAFVSKKRQMQLSKEGYNPILPDLAIEIVSPTDTPKRIERKQQLYAQAGVITWCFFEDTKRVEIRVPGKPIQILGIDDVIDGGEVLMGFRLPVKKVFRG